MKTINEISCPAAWKPMTKAQLDKVESILDKLFSDLKIDIEFSRHFFDRLNDTRNKQQISHCELVTMFKSLYKKFGVQIKDAVGAERLIKSLSTDINIPVVIKWNKSKSEIEVLSKTIMRKRGFKSSTAKMSVESVIPFNRFVHLDEGGQFGHLNNVYDVNFTFNELKHFIRAALKGKLDYVEEKTDGINLMFTVRDGHIKAARNKSTSKNFGDDGLTAASIRDKFKGRAIGEAYGKAIDDLQDAINHLSDKQQHKIFKNGHHWMSVEVMGNGAENVIKYGTDELRLHGTIEFDQEGNKIGSIDKEPAKILDGMLRQRAKHQGKHYKIMKLNRVNLPKVDQFKMVKKKYIGRLKNIMKMTNSSGSDTINDMMANSWRKILHKHTKNELLIDKLIKRFVHYDKSESITQIYKAFPDDKKWIATMNKNAPKITKKFKLPLEKVFLGLGHDVLQGMTEFMALNPDKTVQKLKKELEDTIKKIEAHDNPAIAEKLALELDRLNSMGKGILGTEGVTFLYKGHFMKLTGKFAPINQIIGLQYRLK